MNQELRLTVCELLWGRKLRDNTKGKGRGMEKGWSRHLSDKNTQTDSVRTKGAYREMEGGKPRKRLDWSLEGSQCKTNWMTWSSSNVPLHQSLFILFYSQSLLPCFSPCPYLIHFLRSGFNKLPYLLVRGNITSLSSQTHQNFLPLQTYNIF